MDAREKVDSRHRGGKNSKSTRRHSADKLKTNSRQETADNRQETVDSRQQTADGRQQTADSRQQTAGSRRQTDRLRLDDGRGPEGVGRDVLARILLRHTQGDLRASHGEVSEGRGGWRHRFS
jgi:hypothetical protein